MHRSCPERAACGSRRSRASPSSAQMAAMLEGFVDKVVEIVTNDGRVIVGLLKGFDQTTNVILTQCHELFFVNHRC